MAGIAFLAVLSVGATYWAMKHPERVWAFVQEHMLPGDLRLEFEHLEITPSQESWRSWRLNISARQAKLLKSAPVYDLQAEDIDIELKVQLGSDYRLDFEKFRIKATRPMIVSLRASDPKQEINAKDWVHRLSRDLESAREHTSLKSLNLEVRELRLQKESGEPLGVLEFKAEKPEAAEPMKFHLAFKSADASALVDGQLEIDKIESSSPFLRAQGQVKGYQTDSSWQLSAVLGEGRWLAQIKGGLNYQVDKIKIRFEPDIQFHYSDYQLEMRFTGWSKGFPGPVPQLDRLEGQMFMPFDKTTFWSEWPAKFKVTGTFPVLAAPKFAKALENACECALPKAIRFQFPGEFWFKKQEVTAKLTLEPQRNKLFDLDLGAEFRAAARDNWKVIPKLDSRLHVRSFQFLRKALDSQGVMIPSPLDILDGTIDVTAKADLLQDKEALHTTVQGVTALRSENQLVNLESDLDIELLPNSKNMRVVANVLIRDLQLDLPPLDPLGGMPSLVPDPRVQLRPPKNAAASKAPKLKVEMMLGARTAHPGAIRLNSNLAQPYVPLALELNRSKDGGMSGQVQVEPFDLVYLRRPIHVTHLRLLAGDSHDDSPPVDGKFVIDRTEYKITVQVAGTLSAPMIQVSSEPFLNRSEIISVLLFDRTSDQLASADVETAGNFEAAVVDRAIGLFGLWAFSSTPIRGFYYNPVSHVYSATVQLPKGVTATVGTDWDKAASLEVRKRLSRRWVLTAGWSPSDSDQKRAGSLVLQWEKRF
jgi:hypothetical protein